MVGMYMDDELLQMKLFIRKQNALDTAIFKEFINHKKVIAFPLHAFSVPTII